MNSALPKQVFAYVAGISVLMYGAIGAVTVFAPHWIIWSCI